MASTENRSPLHEIVYSDEGRTEDRDAIAAGLLDFNRRNAPPANFQMLGLLLKTSVGSTVGGLWGRSAYEWLFVEMLLCPNRFAGPVLVVN